MLFYNNVLPRLHLATMYIVLLINMSTLSNRKFSFTLRGSVRGFT